MKIGVVQFPGSTCDRDVFEVLAKELGVETNYLWFQENDVAGLDLVILPGGFSYGDAIRPGALAANTPIMSCIKQYAQKGGKVLGICNGFQILCESHLLSGQMLKNQHERFICRTVTVQLRPNISFFNKVQPNVFCLSVAHGTGAYWAEETTLLELEKNQQIVFCYHDSFENGSINRIAGICNEAGNVIGMMPHPERTLGYPDGLRFWKALLRQILENKL